ncbi:dnaJ homolog subfamily C member 14 [Rhineura floridana]|uniref:dnaJ homolog subfamily C member 14 n=1 Tax=Rhineura floridana TaxID=261503 RepID=UPI002AC82CC8|nr:dnaJ homolog subfamily C member 14 [Rhineura floridana]XP_061471444.1 dnaJ homolog subfamily C member 14 [Rhineura floridana]XP_061471445.1 dnaJ homolog subfamily C member 14 [Rhineura floridana]XP_061471447.1 dnaJ homolog subfamily C member 14 [Rhineura floridana]XP_061471448.1 dnaJ homolog subfamily C member 14 [Rhineura floridana]
MEDIGSETGNLCECKPDCPDLARTLLGTGSPCVASECSFSDGMDAGSNMFIGGQISQECGSCKVCPRKEVLVLEATEACELAPEKTEILSGEEGVRETEIAWNRRCDQDNGGLHFTGYNAPGNGAGSCHCQGETSDLSATYSEKGHDLCGFTCHHWPSASKEKDTSKLPQDQEDVEDDTASKSKEELPDCTRAPAGRKVARQQRHRSAAKDKGEGRFALSGGKYRQTRKRSDGGRHHDIRAELLKHLEGLASFCVSCFKLFISLIVQVTHRCGEGVEAGGKLLYSCCSLSPRDLDTIRTSMQAWIQYARLGCRKLTRQLGSWVSVAYHLLKMLCAVLFLVLMLLLGSLRLCWRVSKAALFSVLGQLARTSHGAWLLSAIDLPQVWALFKESRTCKWVAGLLLKWHTVLWIPKGLRTSQPGDTAYNGSPGGPGPYQPGEEVARLLAMAHTPEEELNPFQVLGLEATASDAELKRAYRHLAVLVHPDKNKHPRAEEAFKVLRAAWDIVSNPERRKEYEIKRMAETELTKSMNEFLSKLQDDLKEAMNTMMCNKCQGKHKRFEMDRDALNARYCAECSKLHAAEEGDFWAESSMLGLKITYFAMMDGKVYDITEWAGCQRVGISPDTHRVPYHISFGSRGSGGRQRAASDGSPASAAELQDFFNRIFQGNPGQMPNGNFFSTPQPPSAGGVPTPPAPSSKVDSTSQKGDSKQKRRKKVRRPFQR